MTTDWVFDSTFEPQQQPQTSGESSFVKSSLQDDFEEKAVLDIVDGQGDSMGMNEIRVANAVITGWQLILVLIW
jgi:hypothetical protein